MTTLQKFIAAAIALAVAFMLIYSLIGYIRLSRLEKEAQEAVQAAEASEESAAKLERDAAAYREKIAYLESQLAAKGETSQKQEHEIKRTNAITRTARADADRAQRTRATTQPPKNSAASLPNSGIHANELAPKGLTKACAAAADELKAQRSLAEALTNENLALSARLETERATNEILRQLNETRKAETEALRTALAAKNETIAAKDAAIASQQELIKTLRGKKRSVLSRIGDVLIGVAAAAVLL